MPSYAATTSGSGGGSSFSTIPGQYINQGIGGLVDFANKYRDNETIGNLTAGRIADLYGTLANTGANIAYNDAFLNSLGTYQQGIESLKTGNTLQLMGAEGAIARDLTDLTTSRTLESNKYLADRELEGSKYGSDRTLESNRYVADRSLDSNRYAADRSLDSDKYVADRDLDKSRYIADRGLEGTKYGYDSQERQIGLTGEQERLTQADKTVQEKRLRADARGAIRSQGARFYG